MPLKSLLVLAFAGLLAVGWTFKKHPNLKSSMSTNESTHKSFRFSPDQKRLGKLDQQVQLFIEAPQGFPISSQDSVLLTATVLNPDLQIGSYDLVWTLPEGVDLIDGNLTSEFWLDHDQLQFDILVRGISSSSERKNIKAELIPNEGSGFTSVTAVFSSHPTTSDLNYKFRSPAQAVGIMSNGPEQKPQRVEIPAGIHL